MITTPRLAEEAASHESIAVIYAGRKGAAKVSVFRILIVDDNGAFARGLSRLLLRRGHRVQCANTGVAALKLAHAFQPEFVMVDVSLPDLSGYEIAALLPGVTSSPRM